MWAHFSKWGAQIQLYATAFCTELTGDIYERSNVTRDSAKVFNKNYEYADEEGMCEQFLEKFMDPGLAPHHVPLIVRSVYLIDFDPTNALHLPI